VLKRSKLHQFFNGVTRTFSCTQAWVLEGDRKLKFSAKKVVFLVSSGKKQISPLLPPQRKTFRKISAKKVVFLVSSGKKQISPLLPPQRKTFRKIH